MAEVDDDRLLDVLTVALRPDASLEPRPAELAAFRSLVSTVGATTARGTSRARRPRRWAAGLLAGGIVVSGGTAYATSGVAPRPVRSAAFALRLPVEAPELTDAKEALDDLEDELREGRADQVAAAVADVEDELADLSPAARRRLEPRASSLVATALAFLADAAEVAAVEDDRSSGDSGSSGPGSDNSASDDSGSGRSTGDDAGDDGSGSDSGGGGSSGSDSDDSGDSSGSRGSGSDGGSEPDEPSSGDDSPNRGSGSSGSGSGSDDDAGVSASGAERDLDDLDDIDDIGHLGD